MKPCKCGSSSRLIGNNESKSYIKCNNEKCWAGPICDTTKEAETVWDELMGDREPNRKPIQMVSADNKIFVLCDDGSVFEWVGKWQQLQAVPGTEADR